MAESILIRGAEVVDCSGTRRSEVLIDDGVIREVGQSIDVSADEVIDATGSVLTPGFVDMHVHLREPGGERAETIATGASAAALGGYSAVVAMANTNPVADCRPVIEFVLARAAEAARCRVLPAGAITLGLEGERLAPLGELFDAGVRLFSDDGRCLSDPELMRRALEYVRPLGAIISNHAEDPSLVGASNTDGGEREGVMNEGEVSSRLGVAGRPESAETVVIARDLLLAEAAGAPLHIPHLSTAAGLDLVRAARQRGVTVTCEVTPHHLTIDESACCDYDTSTRVNPPLRTRGDTEALVAGVASGEIDVIATDHAPHPDEEKERPFEEAPPGMIGLETAFALLYERLVLSGTIPLECLLEAMSWRPAKILGIEKDGFGGEVREGRVANLVLFDPKATWVVDPDLMASKSSNTPLRGSKLTGRVTHTIFEGRMVVRECELVGAER